MPYATIVPLERFRRKVDFCCMARVLVLGGGLRVSVVLLVGCSTIIAGRGRESC